MFVEMGVGSPDHFLKSAVSFFLENKINVYYMMSIVYSDVRPFYIVTCLLCGFYGNWNASKKEQLKQIR